MSLKVDGTVLRATSFCLSGTCASGSGLCFAGWWGLLGGLLAWLAIGFLIMSVRIETELPMTDAEALRRLRRAGWSVVRQGRTSHLLMSRGDEQRVFAVGRRSKHRVSRSQRHAILKATKGDGR